MLHRKAFWVKIISWQFNMTDIPKKVCEFDLMKSIDKFKYQTNSIVVYLIFYFLSNSIRNLQNSNINIAASTHFLQLIRIMNLSETRSALQISNSCFKADPDLMERIESTDYQIHLWPVFEKKFLILMRKDDSKSQIGLVSRDGILEATQQIRGPSPNIELLSDEFVIIYERGYANRLLQWNLKTNELIRIRLKNQRADYCDAIVFPESSLICLYEITKIQYSGNLFNQTDQFLISLAYHRYPLQNDRDSLVYTFSFVQSFFETVPYVNFLVKMDNKSMVGVTNLQYEKKCLKDKKKSWLLLTYSPQQKLKKYILDIKLTKSQFSKVNDLQKLGPYSIYLRMRKNSVSSYQHYILTEKAGKTTIIQVQNVCFQFLDCFKYHCKFEYYSERRRSARYYVNAETMEIWGKFEETEKDWMTSCLNYDRNMEFWWKYNREDGEFLIREVRLGELRFQKNIIMAFLMLATVEDLDDDLIYGVLGLLD